MSSFEKEKAVGLALRAIVQDNTDVWKNTLKGLYGDTDIGKVCYKWHTFITCNWGNMELVSEYVAIIIDAFISKINLDEDEDWRYLMLIKIGPEYMELMNKFTQIPQLAARDLSDKKKFESNPWG